MESNAKNLNIDEFIELFKCPVTKKIFLNPVLCNDNKVYEEQSIMVSNNMTLVTNYIPLKSLKSFIEALISRFPEYKKEQYELDNSIKIAKTHHLHVSTISKIFDDKRYSELKKYTNFDLTLFVNIERFLGNVSEDVLQYVIDNAININVDLDSTGWSLLNYMCRVSSKIMPNIIRYAVDHGADFLHICKSDGWYPLHQIINYCTNENLIIWGINKHLECGMDLYTMTQEKGSVLSSIFNKCPKKIIEYALTKIDFSSQQFKDNANNILNSLDGNSALDTNDKDDIRENIIALVHL